MALTALDDVLDALHVTGSIVLHRIHHAPWAVDVPDAGALCDRLGVPSGTSVVPFHLVVSGGLDLSSTGQPPQHLAAGQMVLLAGGDAHRMGNGTGAVAVPFESLLESGRTEPVGAVAPGADSPGSDVLCGAFMLRGAAHNPLTTSLPARLTLSTDDGPGGALIRLLIGEVESLRPGRAYATRRLLELLYAEAVRWHVATGDAAERGFVAALADARIARVLDVIHGARDKPLGVPELAREAGLSPSRFAARFRALLGVSPVAYATSWRLDRAADRLREDDIAVERVAEEFGYASTPAFTRAFTRRHGATPGRWRVAARASHG